MKRHIRLKDKTIVYTVRKSTRARHMRLSVYWDGVVVATVPHAMQESVIERFIRARADWLFSKIAFFKQFKSAGVIPRRGLRAEYAKQKERAHQLISTRLDRINALYEFTYEAAYIRNQQTLWGSCTRGKKLLFNYRLIYLPLELQDYVIAHELCHLREMNHSPAFWALVEKAIPDYKRLRKELRRYRF